MNTKLTSLTTDTSTLIQATAPGYSFGLSDNMWKLDKNVTINVGQVAEILSEPYRYGFRKTLAFIASNLSSGYTKEIASSVLRMLRVTNSTEINEVVLINYRSTLTARTEHYLGTVRSFLKHWHNLGYPGINRSIIKLIYNWRLKGCRKGDIVKRLDPLEGPLTDIELQSFNEGVIQAYEQKIITISELALCLVTSNTGRRPIQISHLRIIDVLSGKNTKDEPFYILNIPRAKQGTGFRVSFKPFAMTEELWAILSAQSRYAIKQVEACLGFRLQERDRQQVPIFPDLNVAKSVSSPAEFRRLASTDKLHIKSAVVTEKLQFAVDVTQIQSERTGEVLMVNARRFRYTTGTRAAREGFGEMVIAELLDHSDTQNAGVYVKNIPEHVKRLDEAVGFQLAPYAQAFAGVLVDTEKDANRGNDPTSRIRTEEGQGVGTCGEFGFCGANVPIPCYTCMHFQPWLDGPHEEVYQNLLNERERLIGVTGDLRISAVLDRSILAVAEVIQRCDQRRKELNQVGMAADG